MKDHEKLATAITFFLLAFLILCVMFAGCETQHLDHGEYSGTRYSVTSLIDPLTASAELCRIPALNRVVMKFRDGIHPHSGRGPVILLSPNEPVIAQLFDGSSWEDSWLWYRTTDADIIFYFDGDMPQGLTCQEATAWFQGQLPITSSYGRHKCTLYEYKRNAVGSALTMTITW